MTTTEQLKQIVRDAGYIPSAIVTDGPYITGVASIETVPGSMGHPAFSVELFKPTNKVSTYGKPK